MEQIFEEALAQEPAARDALVTRACAGDAELAAQVRELLALSEQPTSQLAGAIPAELSAWTRSFDLRPGDTLGRFMIEEKLGEGGMGAVYAAFDPALQRRVALKLLPRQQLYHEARSAAALSHRHIAALYETGEDAERAWFAMELVEGRSVRDRLAAGPMAPAVALTLLRQLGEALAHAHAQGVIHRDIKPENLMLTADGVLKVVDFGIASTRGKSGDGGAFVTPAYAAPELLENGRPTPAADVYSAGVVMHELLTGARPGEGPVPAPGAFQAVLARSLAARAEERWADGERWLAALRLVTPEVSLAVLDFANLGGGEEVNWLGVALAETLAVSLGKLPETRVANRARLNATPERAAWGVKWVVEGSFQRAGARLRVMVRVTEAGSGEVLTAESLDGEWEELFSLQDRVALVVSEAVASGSRPALPQTRSLDAYELYARGRHELQQMRPDALANAIRYLEQAIALDPHYALAHSALGTTYALNFIRLTKPEDARLASQYLEQAIALDPELGEPYPWLANIRPRQNDVAGGFAAGRRGVELQPDLAEAHYFYGGLAYMFAEYRMAELQMAAETLAEAVRWQPYFHPAWQGLGMLLAYGGNHEQAEPLFDRAIELESDPRIRFRFVGAHALRATSWLRSGQWERARIGFGEALTALESGPNHLYRDCFVMLSAIGAGELALREGETAQALLHFRHAARVGKEAPRMVGSFRLLARATAGLAAAYASQGERARAAELFREVEDQVASVVGQPQSVTVEASLGQLYLGLIPVALALGEEALPLEYLEKAVQAGWADAGWLRCDRLLAPLRETAEFKRVLSKIPPAPRLSRPPK